MNENDDYEVVNLSTKVTDEDLANAIEDEYGVSYSPDGKRLLKGNDELETYQVRPGTKVICDWAFDWCTSLQRITLPASVTSIGFEAFWRCESLREVALPAGLTSIGFEAFKECKSLREITLPKSLRRMGANPFLCCGITNIVSESPRFKVVGNGLYNADSTHLISYFGKEAFVTLPTGLTSIGDGAFSWCDSLLQITLPAGVTCIGDEAFYGCKSLREISMPASLDSIEKGAFSRCDTLWRIIIPNGSREKFQEMLPKGLHDILIEE